MTRVIVALAVHNRREMTIKCIRDLRLALNRARVDYQFVAVDDGSSDGTWQALTSTLGRNDVLLRGSGELYWARSMRLIMNYLIMGYDQSYDYILLVNDDVLFSLESVRLLLACCPDDGISVGRISDLLGRHETYGPYARGNRRRLDLPRALPDGSSGVISAFNANAVAVSRVAFERLGPFSRAWSHGLADYDYGLRARRSGIPITATEKFIGRCDRHSPPIPWMDQPGVRQRWRAAQDPRALPAREWLLFCLRHGGIFGLPVFARYGWKILRGRSAGPLTA